MANYRVPGPACQIRDPLDLRDGTLALRRTPSPQPIGVAPAVTSWPAERKLLEAARRTTPRLPEEMQAQFEALFSAENLKITVAVLTLWAGSHYVGVGEIVDVLLLAAGVVLLGWQIVQVADDIRSYTTVAAGATTEADLERAADHLAKAVTVIGVALFAALIAKGAQRAGLKSKLQNAVRIRQQLAQIAARLTRNLDDVDGAIATLIRSETDPARQAALLTALERLEQQLPNFAGRPRLRVTQKDERWLRVSDMFDEAGQTSNLKEVASGRTLSASDQGRYLGKSDTREANAVLSSWNRMNIVEEQIVSKGSIVLEGPTSPKTSAAGAWMRDGEHLAGGGMQIFHFGQLSGKGQLLAPAVREATSGFIRDPTGKKLPDM